MELYLKTAGTIAVEERRPKASAAFLESREVQALLVVLSVTAGCTDIISFLGRLVLPAGLALLAFDLGFAARAMRDGADKLASSRLQIDVLWASCLARFPSANDPALMR